MSELDEVTSSVTVFYSYAHADETLRNELEKHLSSLRREGLITEWYDRQIVPGTDWAQSIDAHLMTASVILLLISSDFLASDYCYSIEMQQAMKRHHDGSARVIPIILRPVEWERMPFAKLQALPTGAKPITTWSNRDKAFLDIVKGIRKAVEDLHTTSFIWKAIEKLPIQQSALPYWTIPYRRNTLFTGRDDIFKQLHEKLTTNRSPFPQTQALSGLAGIGKTQIAIEYAYRYQDEYDAIFWVRADTWETLNLDIATIAHTLNLSGKDADDLTTIFNSVITWLERHTRWLIVFDNADDLSILDKILPARNSGHIIITTRLQATGSIANCTEVEKMQLEQGTLFLLRRAKIIEANVSLDQVPHTDRVKAEAISKAMDGHALALDQAGAYIEETKCDLSAYLDLYQKQRRVLLQRPSREHFQPIATTFSLCLQKVEKANRDAADLLRLLAFLREPDVISEGLITDKLIKTRLKHLATDPFLWNAAIEDLLKLSLVRRDPSKKALSIHRLLQSTIRDEMNKSAQSYWSKFASLLEPAPLPTDVIPIEKVEMLSLAIVIDLLRQMAGEEGPGEDEVAFSLHESAFGIVYKYKLLVGIINTKTNQLIKAHRFRAKTLDDHLAQIHNQQPLAIYT